jgi:hypothetical protein
LEIQDAKTEIVPATYDPAMVKSLLPKVEWGALRAALRSIGGHSAAGLASDLPETKAEAMKLCAEDDEATLRALFRVLVEIQVTDGYLVCPSTGRRYAAITVSTDPNSSWQCKLVSQSSKHMTLSPLIPQFVVPCTCQSPE